MSLLKNVSLIRRRYAPGSRVNGRWQGGTPDDVPFKGTWQPASGQTLQLLPEGKRSGEVYKAFGPIAMDFTAADAHKGAVADIIVWNEKEYEVTLAARWNNGLIPHWELICTRQKEGES
jgi:hypothetical protein